VLQRYFFREVGHFIALLACSVFRVKKKKLCSFFDVRCHLCLVADTTVQFPSTRGFQKVLLRASSACSVLRLGRRQAKLAWYGLTGGGRITTSSGPSPRREQLGSNPTAAIHRLSFAFLLPPPNLRVHASRGVAPPCCGHVQLGRVSGHGLDGEHPGAWRFPP
jgi:hypothetical protein